MTYYYGTILRICHFLLAFGRSSMAICVYYLLLVGIQLLLYIGISIIYTTILSNEYYGIFPCIIGGSCLNDTRGKESDVYGPKQSRS